jgi:hypothetical protein
MLTDAERIAISGEKGETSGKGEKRAEDRGQRKVILGSRH